MNKFDALSSYMAEMADIMQEMAAKMQRVKEIKAEMDKLKQVETKTKATKVTSTTGNNKITCECGCKINKSSWYTHIKTKKHAKLLSQTPKAEVKQEQIKAETRSILIGAIVLIYMTVYGHDLPNSINKNIF